MVVFIIFLHQLSLQVHGHILPITSAIYTLQTPLGPSEGTKPWYQTRGTQKVYCLTHQVLVCVCLGESV